jgi:hypothetical protein
MLTPRRTDNNSHEGDRVRGTIIQDLEIFGYVPGYVSSGCGRLDICMVTSCGCGDFLFVGEYGDCFSLIDKSRAK